MKKILFSSLLILLLLILIFPCIGCTPPHSDPPESSSSSPEKIKIPKYQTISIMCNDTTKWYVEFLSECFMRRNGDVTVNIIYLEGTSSEDYTNALNERLENGTAPDIMLLCNTRLTKNDVSLLRSDYFADIDAINAKYHHIDWQDYETKIVDAGIFDGKRKILPAYYEVPILLGVKEHLDESGILYGSEVTFTEFVKSTETHEGFIFKNPILAHEMYRRLGLDLIDQWGGEADLNNTVFKDFIKDYNTLFRDIYNGKYSSFVHKSTALDPDISALLDNEILFLNRNRASFSYLPVLDNSYEKIVNAGKTPIITTIPNIDGSVDVAGSLGWCFAVNANTECEEAALRFLEYATNLYYIDDTEFPGIPVNKKYNDAIKAMYYGEEIELPKNVDGIVPIFKTECKDKEFLDSYYDILSNVTMHNYVDIDALSFVELVCVDVTVNGMSLDEAIRKNEVKLKLSFIY